MTGITMALLLEMFKTLLAAMMLPSITKAKLATTQGSDSTPLILAMAKTGTLPVVAVRTMFGVSQLEFAEVKAPRHWPELAKARSEAVAARAKFWLLTLPATSSCSSGAVVPLPPMPTFPPTISKGRANPPLAVRFSVSGKGEDEALYVNLATSPSHLSYPPRKVDSVFRCWEP